MPLILLFCVVGTFAINNTVFEVGVMLVAGVVAYLLEANGFPIAPAILGVVLGGMLEENFITSMIKSNGDLGAFFGRPIALGLAVLTMVVWFARFCDERCAHCAAVAWPRTRKAPIKSRTARPNQGLSSCEESRGCFWTDSRLNASLPLSSERTGSIAIAKGRGNRVEIGERGSGLGHIPRM